MFVYRNAEDWRPADIPSSTCTVNQNTLKQKWQLRKVAHPFEKIYVGATPILSLLYKTTVFLFLLYLICNLQSKLEALITSQLISSTDRPEELVQLLARAYSLLPRCGGAGDKGIKHTEAWTVYFSKLIVTAHKILDQLYQDLEEGQ